MSGLGRRIPPDLKRIEKYPLTPDTAPTKPVPVVLGINWYELFDSPKKIHGDWWINARDTTTDLGNIRGGHAICCEPGTDAEKDTTQLYSFYDQGDTSACTGFSGSRMMSLLNNHVEYDAEWLYHQAQAHDGFVHSGDDGSTVRAACSVLKNQGHERPGGQPSIQDGIKAYRWATSASQVAAALGNPEGDKRQAVVLLNSWGSGYPERVYLHLFVVDRLLSEQGEACIVTDR